MPWLPEWHSIRCCRFGGADFARPRNCVTAQQKFVKDYLQGCQDPALLRPDFHDEK